MRVHLQKQNQPSAKASAELAPRALQQPLRSPGQPLDSSVRANMEARFGHDFGRVRVHTDGEAAERADSVHARAYTLGQDIVMGAGEYAPYSQAGRRLIAHELAHVVQQRSGGPIIQRQAKDSSPAACPGETATDGAGDRRRGCAGQRTDICHG